MNPTRSAGVISRPERIYLHSDSMTPRQLWVASPPYLTVELDASDAELGAAVRVTLAASRTDAEDPPDPSGYRKYGEALLKHFGFRSLRAFATGARYVGIGAEGTAVDIYPSKSHGSGRYNFLADYLTLPNPTDAELGAAIRKAFELSS
jgi:hypothetical protein